MATLVVLIGAAGVAVYFGVQAFFFASSSDVAGEVYAAVQYADDGTTGVERIDLATGLRTRIADEASLVDPSVVVSNGGTVYRVTRDGVVRIEPNGVPPTVLIRSSAPPVPTTPLAVFGEGEQIAWVSPASRSLEVYERVGRDKYAPITLTSDLFVQSISFFSPDMLVATRLGPDGTELIVLASSSPSIQRIFTTDDFILLIPHHE